MNRELVGCPESAPASAKGTPEVYDVEAITPMFGGSATPREVDGKHPVRISAIRGHLRFWWRATRGASCATVGDLRDQEGRIWGNTKLASPVRIELSAVKEGTRCAIGGYPAYALFPFKEDHRHRIEAADGRVGVSFRLRLECPAELEKDVAAAMWAWVNFGGIGARTRRGAGALYCAKLAAPDRVRMGEWLAGKIEEFGLVTKDEWRPWPFLSFAPGFRPRIVQDAQRDATLAWAAAVKVMYDFRQGVPTGRKAGTGKKSGRSHWPEADSIRALTGESEGRHEEPVTLANPGAHPGFPRAGLGLPIVLKFYHEDVVDARNDCEISPADASRMASPIILRPIKTADGHFFAMAVCLKARQPDELKINFYDRATSLPPGTVLDRTTMRRPDLASYPASPMHGRTRHGVALEAFLTFAGEHGFREVK